MNGARRHGVAEVSSSFPFSPHAHMVVRAIVLLRAAAFVRG